MPQLLKTIRDEKVLSDENEDKLVEIGSEVREQFVRVSEEEA